MEDLKNSMFKSQLQHDFEPKIIQAPLANEKIEIERTPKLYMQIIIVFLSLIFITQCVSIFYMSNLRLVSKMYGNGGLTTLDNAQNKDLEMLEIETMKAPETK
jgi:hypothetical protein